MPWSDNSTIQSLRLQYNAALAGYRACARRHMDARIQGLTPSLELLAEAETKARLELEAARTKLLAATTEVITGGVDFEPPTNQG